jgi:predicted phage baseplate assembly protein
MKSSEICQDTAARRRRIRERAGETGANEPNGIDYVEIGEDQKTISVYFLNKAPHHIRAENIRITGGVRIRDIRVVDIHLCEIDDPDEDDCLRVMVNHPGDFSTYTLRLVGAHKTRAGDEPLAGFDPRYAQIDFSFKANCPSDLDCEPMDTCSREPLPEPDIDYLARDYNSFRQLLLDRLSLVMPDWKERHIPDLGIALVELFAYVGDYLSYYQDAVATEAYLDTARQRTSVRRHARLVDYLMHEGCNARTWVSIETGIDLALSDPKDVYFITGHAAQLDGLGPLLKSDRLSNVPPDSYEVYEPLLVDARQPINLYRAHNRISFYTWGDLECCLPRGATSASLKDGWTESSGMKTDEQGGSVGQDVQTGGEYPEEDDDSRLPEHSSAQAQNEPEETYGKKPTPEPAPQRERQLRLKVGDVLIFEEVLGPVTGAPADADTSHRHAVRLTRVEPRVDNLYDQPVLDIEWEREDALPFTLCISSLGRAPECCYLQDVSIARGNIVLVDHGRTMKPESWTVPAAVEQSAGCIGPFEPRETILQAGRFRPRLKYRPLTHRAPFPEPATLRRAQARYLGQLIDEVRRRVEQLRERARHGQHLSQEDLSELKTIFGSQALAEVGLFKKDAKGKYQPGGKDQAAAVGGLLARFEKLLARKARWVKTLVERVLNGYVVSAEERREIGEMFGERFSAGLTLAVGQIPGPASLALRQQPQDALPCIIVRTRPRPAAQGEEKTSATPASYYPRWTVRQDLLGSTGEQRHFVAEIDNEGRAHLRFGDGELGRAPDPEMLLQATYRTGNVAAGNVGAETISHIVFRQTKTNAPILRVRNPLPAQGGIAPESIEEVKVFAPGAFRKDLQRAVIAQDYASLAERNRLGQVQRATASLRWAGSWYEMETAIDPRGTAEAEAQLFTEIEGSLYRYRRIGHDLMVKSAHYVPLDVALSVYVRPHYLRGHVKAALSDVFSNRVLPNGQRGLFHPDNLSFGEAIYLSRLVAAAQAVEGVESVRVLKLQRLFEGASGELEKGLLPLKPLEVARLDNDPSFPENGRLTLDVRGGR